ncbi:saccharopine dehydrogenase family protein [Bacteroidota bacterium]
MNEILIYGANGYSAKLIINEMIKKNIKPILGGRNELKIKSISSEYKLDYRIFDLENNSVVEENLSDIHTLLNCAGPFIYTSEILITSCIKTKTNYLDITGEIPAIQIAWNLNNAAKESGITILPSVGLDVIPTDCLAKRLSEKLPEATKLQLGLLSSRGKISKGTWLATLEAIKRDGKIRRKGKIIDSKIGDMEINFRMESILFRGISIPWGDVCSAYYSTKIPNIDVFLGLNKIQWKIRYIIPLIRKILLIRPLEKLIIKIINSCISGPSQKHRDVAETIIWGRISNERKSIEEAYKFDEGYNLTALGATECVIKVLRNEVSAGTKTPSLAFGSNFMDMFVKSKLL